MAHHLVDNIYISAAKRVCDLREKKEEVMARLADSDDDCSESEDDEEMKELPEPMIDVSETFVVIASWDLVCMWVFARFWFRHILFSNR